jgi:hypothetical protein
MQNHIAKPLNSAPSTHEGNRERISLAPEEIARIKASLLAGEAEFERGDCVVYTSGMLLAGLHARRQATD